jgi:hypothetical protein
VSPGRILAPCGALALALQLALALPASASDHPKDAIQSCKAFAREDHSEMEFKDVAVNKTDKHRFVVTGRARKDEGSHWRSFECHVRKGEVESWKMEKRSKRKGS